MFDSWLHGNNSTPLHINTPTSFYLFPESSLPVLMHTQKLEAQLPYSGAVGLSPAQFYVRRDHTLGGSVSRLDRLRTHQELPYMETFVEVEEELEEEEEEENEKLDKQEHISGEYILHVYPISVCNEKLEWN